MHVASHFSHDASRASQNARVYPSPPSRRAPLIRADEDEPLELPKAAPTGNAASKRGKYAARLAQALKKA
ncbi:hypothetical protein EMIT0P218_10946 [Pseudomonas sp. IT-P218]